MFKMIIAGNPKQVIAEGLYSPADFNGLLRQLCLETGFKESSPGHYYLEPNEDELGRMIVLEAKFRKLKIVPNLAEWKTFSDEEGEVDELAPYAG